ncbi:MAG: CoA pyrophosphatase [Myxococcales bacterium]|nr:CoA pyrophosphatase [Myxococcales bacterium]
MSPNDPSSRFALSLGALRERLQSKAPPQEQEHDGPRAAVAMILRAREAHAEVLMIQRAEHPQDPWSGHVAFPGGRKDEADRDVRATAERETREEVGLDLAEHGALLWRMPDVNAVARGRRTGLVIAPLVYELGTEHAHRGDSLVYDPSEVAATMWVSLAFLADERNHSTMNYVHEGKTVVLPCVRLEGGRVLWGLTLQMTSALFDAIE